MGIIALGIGFGAPLAVAGALLHVVTHAAAKGLAFFGAGSLLRGYDTKEVDGITDAWRAMPWTGSMFLAAALALCGLPLSGVFRSEFQIVAGGFARPQYVGVTLLLIGVNVAFFGVIGHAARMVLSRPPELTGDGVSSVAHVARERSAWMIAGMLGCLFVSVALGVHLPGQLVALLNSAAHRLAVPS
jgi:hydrogenase-4 component F